MAIKINLKHDQSNISKAGFVGFSFTTLFFGFFVPLFRGDILWAVIMFIMQIGVLVPTFGMGNIVLGIILGCIYNKIYTTKLLTSGWDPADSYSENILVSRGYIFKERSSDNYSYRQRSYQSKQQENLTLPDKD